MIWLQARSRTQMMQGQRRSKLFETSTMCLDFNCVSKLLCPMLLCREFFLVSPVLPCGSVRRIHPRLAASSSLAPNWRDSMSLGQGRVISYAPGILNVLVLVWEFVSRKFFLCRTCILTLFGIYGFTRPLFL